MIEVTTKTIKDKIPELKSRVEFLECDGSTNVLSWILQCNNIPHKIKFGTVFYQDKVIPLHYWIEVGKLVLDLKLRMWVGDSAPEGIFDPLKEKNLKYIQKGIGRKPHEYIYLILTDTNIMMNKNFKNERS